MIESYRFRSKLRAVSRQLDRERRALIAGRLSELKPEADGRAALLEALSELSSENLTPFADELGELVAKSQDVQRLLEAAISGVEAASARLNALKENSLQTYTKEGRRIEVGSRP